VSPLTVTALASLPWVVEALWLALWTPHVLRTMQRSRQLARAGFSDCRLPEQRAFVVMLADVAYHLPILFLVVLLVLFGPKWPRSFSFRGFTGRDLAVALTPGLLTAPLYSALVFWLCGGFNN
jgi:hypothetical protein